VNGQVARVDLQAILENYELLHGSCCIEKLEIQRWCYIEKSLAVFTDILRTMASLRYLTIYLDHSNPNCEWIAQTFRSNTSLEYLYIETEEEVFVDSRVAAPIISSLYRHPNLQTLALRYLTGTDEQNDTALALGHVLRHSQHHFLAWK
jgi:hypothetical protein